MDPLDLLVIGGGMAGLTAAAAAGARVLVAEPSGCFPAFPLGRPMDGVMAVGEVVESRAEGYSPGDTVRLDEPPPGPRNLMLAVTKDLTIRGYRVSSLTHLVPAMTRELAALARAGRLRGRETVVEGLANAPAALAGLLGGENTGKTLVRVS